MENIKNKYLQYLVIQSESFSSDDLSADNRDLLLDYFKQIDENYRRKNNFIKLRFNAVKNYKSKDGENYSFYITINFASISKNIDIIQKINNEFEILFENFEFLKSINARVFNIKTWKVKSLALRKDIQLKHEYSNYVDIIREFNFKYSNLILDYENGNVIYFYSNTSGREPKDILNKSKFVKFSNFNKFLALKYKQKKLEIPERLLAENILAIELKLNKRVKNNASLIEAFKISKGKDLTLEDILKDFDNGSTKLKTYFNNYLRDNSSIKPADILMASGDATIDKEKIYNYLDGHKDKSINNNKALYFIIAALVANLNYSNAQLSELEKFLIKKMTRPNDITSKTKIIKNIKDNIRQRELAYSIAELKNDLYDKIFSDDNEIQSQIMEADVDIDLENDLSFDDDDDV